MTKIQHLTDQTRQRRQVRDAWGQCRNLTSKTSGVSCGAFQPQQNHPGVSVVSALMFLLDCHKILASDFWQNTAEF